MDEAKQIERMAERVERLLLRHDELRRTNALLERELELVSKERDGLKLRLQAARSRVETLLARLPAEEDATQGGDAETNPASSAT